MKNTKKTMVLVLSVALLSLMGCATEGCQDANAKNFEESATRDCLCCEYEGKALFWYNQTTSQEFQRAGITGLFFSVDNKIIGTTLTSAFFKTEPGCATTSAINVTKDLGSSKSKSFTYNVKDQDGNIISEGSVILDSDVSCTLVEISI